MARKKTVKSETTDLAQPQNRTEEFLAKIAGLVDTLPQGEFSRLERYLKYIAENGGGGGGGGVTSFNTRTGAVTPESGDYSEFFAPAGYGLGGAGVDASSSWNTFYRCGFYCASTDSPDGGYWWGFVSNYGNGIVVQNAFTCKATSNMMIQAVRCGRFTTPADLSTVTWYPWEWVNPPLVADTEYRTTERFLGKPVYVQLRSLTIPTGVNTDTATNFGSNVDKVISVEGIAIGTLGGSNYEFTIPYKDAGTNFYGGAFAINGYIAYVYSYTNAGFTWTSGYVIAKYTKTTD